MTSSFRDPAGRLLHYNKRIIRAINPAGEEDFLKSSKSKILRNFVQSGSLVSVKDVDLSESHSLAEEFNNKFAIDKSEISQIVEHEKIPFANYPYEWTPEMLYAGGNLTLDLAENLLKEGLGLKDATPYNILFRATKPVFVDWLSFEKRNLFDPVWLPQAQFVRTFILPLLVNKHFGIPLSQIFMTNRDGLEPDSVYKMSGSIKKMTSPFFSMVTLPKILGSSNSKSSSIYQQRVLDDEEKAQFILSQQFKQLKRLLKKVAPADENTSGWAEYVGPKQHFTDEYLRQKDDFVSESLKEYKPQTILDIGCNTGYFSRIAAQTGASVVALDQDAVSISNVWRLATAENLDILPLIVDITRPSPSIGWRNNECPSFLSRVTAKMDAVMMLAVIHHMLVTERIPLDEILNLISEITNDILIIEFVAPNDPMFKIIARGRDHLFKDLSNESFRKACLKHFKVIRCEQLAQTNRYLYLLQK